MNDGIRYAARPTDSVPKGNFGGMPAEAIAMARQMGMTPEDLKQMDGMWGEMDNLAEADPETYKKFIDDTLKEGPPDKDGKGGGGGGGGGGRGARQFTPVPGFVIKLRTKGDAGAGMTVRTAGGGGDGGQKLFVNVTWHKALEVPKDNFGRPVQRGEKRGADGLQMPLLISKVRPCADHTGQVVASAVDCVFHEWVLIRCEEDNFFKAQVIDLALKWIEDETKFKLNKQWKTIRSSYKGGRGEDGDEPVPFPIDEALMQQDPIEKRKEPEAKSPDAPEIDPVTGIPKPRPGAIPAVSSSKFQTDDLLRSMKNMNQNETQEPLTEIQMPNAGGSAPNRDNGIKGFDVVAPGISGSGGSSKGGGDGAKGAASAPRGPLIQDLDELDDAGASNASSGSSENSGAASTTGGAKKKKKGKVVPGGFLNAKKGKAAPRLYGDEGSTETGAKEGSYSRLMSKCKVVDLSSASPEEQKAAMEQHANTPPVRPANPGAPPAASAAPPKPTPTPPPPAPEPTFDAMGKGFLEGNKAGKIYDGKGSTEGGTPMRVDDPLFDSLIAGIDEEYHQAAQPRKDQAEDDMFKQLGEMASVLGGGGDGGGGFDMASMAKMMESLQGPTPGAMPGSAASAPSPGVSSTLPKPSGGNKSPKGAADGGARGGGGGFAPPKYLLNMSKENGEDVAVITVDMAGVTGGMGDVDLEVGGQAVRVVAAGKQPLLVDLPFELNADMTKAKFSKKKGELKVTVRSS